MCDGAAVDDGGVGSRPAPPNDPASPKTQGLPAYPRPGQHAGRRTLKTPATRGGATVSSGMLTHTTAGRGASGPLWPYPSGPSPGRGAEGRPPDMQGSHGRLAAEGNVVKKPKARLDAWAEAQKRFHLSDLHIQMARELGCAA